MADDAPPKPPIDDSEQLPPSSTDPPTEALREILLGRQQQRISEMETQVEELESRISDEDKIISIIAPVLGEAIRRRIQEAREEMIEALYPIIGQVVARAVSEAISDLARRVDSQVRTSFNPGAIWWRLRARLGGASQEEIALRGSLPFVVTEIFLIHRETGLLLRHVSRDPAATTDSDLVGGMLTAIRDFVQDVFGRGEEGQLEEIEYGERRILIEAARHAYIAVVVDGVEPPGFRDRLREQIIEVEHGYQEILREYEGDPSRLEPVEGRLRSLMADEAPEPMSRTQKRAVLAALSLLALCLLGACLTTRWIGGMLRNLPSATPLPVGSNLTPEEDRLVPLTPLPTTQLAKPAATPSLSAAPQAALSPAPKTADASVVGVMIGNALLWEASTIESERLGVVLEEGQRVEILAQFGQWFQVRWSPTAEAEVVGWVPTRWVQSAGPIPNRIITPSPVP